MPHVQTTKTKAEKIVEEATLLKKKLGGDLYVKIPIGEEGLKATMMLNELGIGVTITAIFTPTQALMAAKSSASFVTPYVNRLDNVIDDGVGNACVLRRESVLGGCYAFEKRSAHRRVGMWTFGHYLSAFRTSDELHRAACKIYFTCRSGTWRYRIFKEG